MNYEHVIFASYGNDSLAMIEWARREGLKNVAVAYSDTGWASIEWEQRLAAGEEFAESCGFAPVRLKSIGLPALVRDRKGWPLPRKFQFCTTVLKIEPARKWLDEVDPDKEAICMVGIRREESRERSQWPEHVEDSDKHGGRECWYPLVRHTEAQRDELIRAAGFEPLPHRSQECFPCINANRTDMRQLTPERVELIETLEHMLGFTSKGQPRTMFRPYRHQGACGIREVHKWAMSKHGQYKKQLMVLGNGGGCDSGFCGT
jgi:3'-phosphoadenosine 5'-phosphosulfate sulfotransferase (PAPS reductase)/FAD synthetase